MPATSHIIMLRPAAFGYNAETAANNYFQQPGEANAAVQAQALAEFEAMVQLLHSAGVQITVLDDEPWPAKPDAVFPNNWFTLRHGRLSLFPMFAPSRRAERQQQLIAAIESHTAVRERVDYTHYEQQHLFLEGTGSMIIDDDNAVAYAALSARTSRQLLQEFAANNGLDAIVFEAVDEAGQPVYHTNVIMAVGHGFAVLCEECIKKPAQLQAVRERLLQTGKTIIPITQAQVRAFCGNILQLQNTAGEPLIVMSKTAKEAFTAVQLSALSAHGRFIVPHIPVIERHGGGGVRCMMAEVFE